MPNQKYSDKLIENFLSHLLLSGVSQPTLKNYKSDIVHFSSWFIGKIRKLGTFADGFEEVVPFINLETSSEYKDFMINTNTASKTVNRRLSTLRNLSRYLHSNHILDFDFMSTTKNIIKYQTINEVEIVINEFKRHLISEKVASNTIKNYMSDVKQFFAWLEQKGDKNG